MMRARLFSITLILVMNLTAQSTRAQVNPNTVPTSNSDGVGTLMKSTGEFDSESFARTFAHRMAEVNGVQIHYVIGGKGPPLVLMHGFLESWYTWRKVMPALAQRYTVIAPDLRGLGDSSRPLTGYDGRTVAEDIYQLVRQLGYERIFLVGHDVGGWMAYAYAAAHRDQVRRLAIVDVPLPGIGLEQLMDTARGGSWHFGFHMVPDLPEALVAGRERTYIAWFARNYSVVPNAITEADIDEYVRSYSKPGAMRAAFSYYRALPEDVRQNRESAKQKLQMPVLAVGASLKGRTLQDLQLVADNVRSVEIANCGHFVAEERPTELVEQLLAFFREERQ